MILSGKELERMKNEAIVSDKKQKPQSVEVVDEETIYLLKPGTDIRVRKICGVQDENGWYCDREAGKGTFHVGTGKCSFHEKEGIGRDQYLVRLGNIISTESSLYEFFNTEQFKNIDVTDTKNLITVLYAIL